MRLLLRLAEAVHPLVAMALAPSSTSPNDPSASSAYPEVESVIARGCQADMAREIAANKGDEVFFIGRLDDKLVVVDVEAYAFGNRQTVPALMQYAQPGDVVIHNHPSGNLEPSNPDITVASELGGRGIASYIINNDCTAVRVIVRPFRPSTHTPIEAEKLGDWLKPGGRVAEKLEGFESRPQQVAMLEAVADAFNNDGIAIIEAATGTGKSLAYLLPAITWALQNNERVIVSTGTINLQEQLVEKDLPLVGQASGLKFEVALLKGRNNYLCQRKADYLRRHPDFMMEDEKRQQLDEIQGWVRTTRDGSLADLPFSPDGDVWELVMSEADNCLRTRCPFYQKCFFYNARRKAARAQVLVVNHHLLLADLAVRAEAENYTQTAVLPPFHRIIFDEAHHLEDVATEHFGGRFSRGSLFYALRRLINPRKGNGLLTWLASQMHGGVYDLPPADRDAWILKLGRELPLLHQELRTAVEEATGRLAEALDRKSGVPLQEPLELKRRLTRADRETGFWEEQLEKPLRLLLASARPYIEQLKMLLRTLERFLEDATPELATPILELRSTLNKVDGQVMRVARFLSAPDESGGNCRWIEYRRKPHGRPPEVHYCMAPLEVASDLRDKVLRRYRTVVMTSATLTVERKFDYFRKQLGAQDALRLGLLGSAGPPAGTPASEDEVDADGAGESPAMVPLPRRGGPAVQAADVAPESRPLGKSVLGDHTAIPPPPLPRPVIELLLDTPFDYERQVLIGVPMDLPEPTAAGFEERLVALLAPTLEASRGRAFVLFTAYGMLGRVFDRVAPRLESQGYPCLRQGQNTRSLLTESFRKAIGSILFATSSFWEGVDVQGEALSLLVLTRLPFKVPNEPLLEAKLESIRARGGDPFNELTVPQAVIKFRQGFGRLIRSRTDRGAILICDNRVATKNYGRVFLRSLPTQRVSYVNGGEWLQQVAAFLAPEAMLEPPPEA